MIASEQAQDIGYRLRRARADLNYSQAEMAQELTVSRRAYVGYENGRYLAQPKRRRAILAWLAQHEAAA
jgi:DNA-binding XRE family transcriptional regulator